jgi:sensor domain CHASE-containing protein
MTMSIRAKTFLGILITMALLTAAFGVSLRLFSQQNIQRVESHFCQQSLLRADNLLKEKQQDLEAIVNSIAILDQLWHFSSGGEDRSHHKKYFASIPVDFILIFDNTRHLSYQFQQHRFENYPGDIQAQLGPSIDFILSPDADRLKVRSGLVLFDHQPLLIAFRQISHLGGMDSPAGTLVMGMSLGDDFWAHVNDEWQMNASLLHLNGEKHPDEKAYYYTSKTLNDLHGDPQFYLAHRQLPFHPSFQPA